MLALHEHGFIEPTLLSGSLISFYFVVKIVFVGVSTALSFILPFVRAGKRIGPHNHDITSILVGSLLGDGYGELLSPNSVRFTF